MNVRCAILASVAVLAAVPAAAATQSETLPIDRWLIADAFGPDSAVEGRLDIDLLDPPGEAGVLPDRGKPASGAVWRLYRNDGVAKVSLDVLQPDDVPVSGTIVYAHVYARLPEDRTLRFVWDAEDCTAGRAWLNGRPIEDHDVRARFGGGWNTILLKLEGGDCGFGYGATLMSERAADLQGVQLQASRPPGEVRTGPEAWVIPRRYVQVSPDRRWLGDRLYGGLEVGLTAWGRSPISNVEVELRGAADGKAAASWLTPGEAEVIVVPIRLDRLQRVLDAGAVDARIRWEDTKIERRLTISGGAPAEAGDRIVLDGWKVNSVTGRKQTSRIDRQLPNAAGWVLKGSWKVPETLAGQTLILGIDASPADYELNGTAIDLAGEPVTLTLCAPCSKGTKLVLTARTTEAWSAMPVVRASGSADR